MEDSINTQDSELCDTKELLRALYRVVFEREVTDSQIDFNVQQIRDQHLSLDAIVASFVRTSERYEKERRTHGAVIDTSYHAPRELERTGTAPARIAVIGSCMTEWWYARFSERCAVDYIQVNHVSQIPDDPPHPPGDYDFQVVQLPLRAILPERQYLALAFEDLAGFERLFDDACARLASILDTNLVWNARHGMLSFVSNFFSPQQPPLGRFATRDLRNPVHFIEGLSDRLAELVAARSNVHVLDLCKLSAIYGSRYHQDDALHFISHHGLIADYEDDSHRPENPRPYTSIHMTRRLDFVDAVWAELIAMYRSVLQVDAIKLVILDLDDTLWRGIAAEGALDVFGTRVREGWPIGVIEALWYLKARGVVLAIASKNDETRIRELWSGMTNDLISLDDFAVVKINWRPKVDSVAEILALTNILPKNVLFIDDSPVERAAIKGAYADIRMLGGDPYDIRRVLLWAPELQAPVITGESMRRTEMLQAQVSRETLRRTMTREEFLASLALTVTLHDIDSPDDARFDRAFELLNKTNQFNTTGHRWRHEEAVSFFARGGTFVTFDVSDAFTRYGLVGVVPVQGERIVQWTMSCRVLGLDIEFAVLKEISTRIACAGASGMRADMGVTDHNFICRSLFAQAGFAASEDGWVRASVDKPAWPPTPHIAVL